MLGGLYQSVLRAELTHRFGVEWGPLLTGQAEIAGVPDELLDVFSKRSAAISAAMAAKLDEFRQREGREPSRFERAALEREASADTRSRKSGHGAADLATRWRTEAAEVGWSVERLEDAIEHAARVRRPVDMLTVDEVVEAVSAMRSSWGRADVLQAICDRQRPVSQLSGHRWADADRTGRRPRARPLRRSGSRRAPRIVGRRMAARCGSNRRLPGSRPRRCWPKRSSSCRGRWTPRPTRRPRRRPSIDPDLMCCRRTRRPPSPATSGSSWWSVRPEPARPAPSPLPSTISTGTVETSSAWRRRPRRPARCERDTGVRSDTVAKLLHEWQRAERPPLPEFQLGAGATVIVDEAGMLTTPALHQLVSLADAHRVAARLGR